MLICMTPVILGKTLCTIHRFIGRKVPCNKITEPGSCPSITAKEDHPAPCSPNDPDIPGMTFTATAGTAGYPDLNFCREGLVFELIVNSPGKPDRVLFPVFAHIGSNTGMDKLDTWGGLWFCERAEISKDPGNIFGLNPGKKILRPDVTFRTGTWYFRPTLAIVSSCSGVMIPAGIRVVTA